jgi:hypothetical protein
MAEAVTITEIVIIKTGINTFSDKCKSPGNGAFYFAHTLEYNSYCM